VLDGHDVYLFQLDVGLFCLENKIKFTHSLICCHLCSSC